MTKKDCGNKSARSFGYRNGSLDVILDVSTTGQDRESLCQPYWTTLVASRITYSNFLVLRGTHSCFTHSLKHILQIMSTCIDEWHRSRRYCYCHRSYFEHEKIISSYKSACWIIQAMLYRIRAHAVSIFSFNFKS
jgi:hypothetical protein